MNIQDRLREKATEIRLGLEGWINTEGLTGPGETLVLKVKFKIVKIPLVQVKKQTGYLRLNAELTFEDWKEITSLPWKQKDRLVIETFQNSQNKPIEFGKLEDRPDSRGPNWVDRVNRMFIKYGLVYRMKRPATDKQWGGSWDTKQFCIHK